MAKFIGAHGAARDVGERDRLERDLRRQAGELAAGEERAHLARELHDSVTQALFSMTLVSRSVELLLDRDPEAAQGPARPAARPPARGAGRDAGADLRAPARATSSRTGSSGRCGRIPRRSRAGSGCRSSSRAPSTSGSRCRSRRSSTGSPRKRFTTSSSTLARARSGSSSVGSRVAFGCGSPTTARDSIHRACRTAISAWPGCACVPRGSGRASRSRAKRAGGQRSRSSSPTWPSPRPARPRPLPSPPPSATFDVVGVVVRPRSVMAGRPFRGTRRGRHHGTDAAP